MKHIKYLIIYILSLFCFKKKSKVIFYHDIHSEKKHTNMSTHIDLFKDHVHMIRNSGYEIVSEITEEYGQIEICFDDGFLGLYENIELIKQYEIPIHLFIVNSFLNKKHYLNLKHLKELNNLELITISSHTFNHNTLTVLDEFSLKKELYESKSNLENLLGKSIDSICFPKGMFNNRVIDIAKKVGYSKQYSSLPGFYYDKFQNIVIKRSLVQSVNNSVFKGILKGADHVFFYWYKLKHFTL